MQTALRARLVVVNGQFRSRVAFADPTVAAAEPKKPPKQFSIILSHRLLIRFRTSTTGQDRVQFALDRLLFGLDLRQKIAEP